MTLMLIVRLLIILIGNLSPKKITLEDASVVEQPPKFPQKNSATRGKKWQTFLAGHPLKKSPNTWSLGWMSEVSIYHHHPQKFHLDFHAWQS